jgi:hypothetical protein
MYCFLETALVHLSLVSGVALSELRRDAKWQALGHRGCVCVLLTATWVGGVESHVAAARLNCPHTKRNANSARALTSGKFKEPPYIPHSPSRREREEAERKAQALLPLAVPKTACSPAEKY